MTLHSILKGKAKKICSHDTVRQIHVVFNWYMEKSIKGMTCDRRGCQKSHHVKPEVPVPTKWKAFLQNDHNKTELISLYPKSLENSGEHYVILLECQELYQSGGHGLKTFLCTKLQNELVAQLKSNQEESDTRIMLHAIFAAKTCNNLVICSPDTDALVLLLHHRDSIAARNI